MHSRLTFFALLIFLVLATFTWIWYDFFVFGTQITEKESKIEKIDQDFEKLNDIKDDFGTIQSRYDSSLAAFDTLKKVIPEPKDYVTVLETIRKIAKKQEIEIESFRPLQGDTFPAIKYLLTFTGKHLVRRPIQMRISGDFLTIGAFLEEVLKMKSKVNIESLTIETELNEGGVLTCDLVLFSYMFLENVSKEI
ncbi:MAG: type 4a pilus biogenesis protein PilO [Fidelibacterota bacterium]